MSFIQIIAALTLLCGPALAAEAAMSPVIQAAPAMSVTLPPQESLPSSALPAPSRTVVLVVGIAAVLVTFQRALSSRKPAA